MLNTIEIYLKDLKSALKGSDAALVQDALWDAETHLRSSVKAAQEKDPTLSEEQALNAVIESYGSPEEVAEAYREREAVIETALRPQAASQGDGNDAPLSPWPGFFGVMATPKAYTSMLYLLMALPVGIFFFTWAATGISLSFGLLFLIIGIPFAIAFLGSVRILALAEGRLVEALLDVRMPRRPPLLPEGKGWGQKLKNLFLDGHTWSSLAYMILHLPVGIFSFMLVVIGLSLSFAFIAAPITHFIFAQPASIMFDGVALAQPAWLLLLLPILGVLTLIATLHLSLAVGRLQGLIAKFMLVRR